MALETFSVRCASMFPITSSSYTRKSRKDKKQRGVLTRKLQQLKQVKKRRKVTPRTRQARKMMQKR